MSKLVWAIALNPPDKKNNILAKVSYGSAATDITGITKPAFDKTLDLATSDDFSFRIYADKAVCQVHFLVQGWIGGGCPPPFTVALNDLGVKTLADFNLDPAIQNAEACLALQCHYNGTGLLVCSGKGVSLTMDLTAKVNSSGLYLAFAGTQVAGEEFVVTIDGGTIKV